MFPPQIASKDRDLLMGKVLITEFEPDKEYETLLLVSSKTLGHTKAGRPYLTLRLVDSSGGIIGRIWEDALNKNKLFDEKDVLRVKARCEQYQGSLQLNILSLEKLDRDEINPEDFLPRCPKDIEKLWRRLKEIARYVKNRCLLELLHLFFEDRELVEKFKNAPAAKTLHHAYLGGLLEHTLSVCELLLKVADHYPELDRDLLITAGIFHDIGKVEEFTYDLAIEYSEVGRLLGHVVLGVKILEEKIAKVADFPEETAILLKHMIISHHGYLEFGSAKRPKTREAFVLYFIDDLDAKIDSVNKMIEAEKDSPSPWTGYSRALERFIFKGWPETREENKNNSEKDNNSSDHEQLSIFSFF
ncbi:MAG: HD family phosphohydrolase [Deltaproteobacteria bacterium]|nr:MAG: HD family phosphohydrolase [Deltaproteobacteria bacterium]